MIIPDYEIERWLEEDVPYIDLTSIALNINDDEATIEYITREDGVVCGTEEVFKLFTKLGIKVEKFLTSGTSVNANDIILKAKGSSKSIHYAYKVGVNILEYSSGIATRTKNMTDIIKNEREKNNTNIELIATRKVFPGTKKLSTKAIISGGALPHRLGLSETILIFDTHTNLLGGLEEVLKKISKIKQKTCEKKVIIEVSSELEGKKALEYGADGIQFEKMNPKDLIDISNELKKKYPDKILIATGGINLNNIDQYSNANIDAIATTNMYFGKPLDIKSKIYKS